MVTVSKFWSYSFPIRSTICTFSSFALSIIITVAWFLGIHIYLYNQVKPGQWLGLRYVMCVNMLLLHSLWVGWNDISNEAIYITKPNHTKQRHTDQQDHKFTTRMVCVSHFEISITLFSSGLDWIKEVVQIRLLHKLKMMNWMFPERERKYKNKSNYFILLRNYLGSFNFVNYKNFRILSE